MGPEALSINQPLVQQAEMTERTGKRIFMRAFAAASLIIGGAFQSESQTYANSTDLYKIEAGETVCSDVGHPGDFAIINATITQPEQAGYATVHKSTANWEASSTNNYALGQTIPNLTITEIGNDGKSCITSFARTHAIEDLSGFLLAKAVTPAGPNGAVRVLDTRQPNSPNGGRKLAAGETVCTDIGHPGDFAIINSTITQPEQDGYATVHKSTADWQASSTNNFVKGQTIASLTLTEIGADGKSCITPMVATHSVIDVQGFVEKEYMRPAGPNGAVRVVDTRQPNSPTGGRKVEAGQKLCVDVGRPGDFAVLNATITQPEQDGYATVHKSTADWQASSTNNFALGQTIPNLSITEIGADGKICIASFSRTHIVEDLVGYLKGGVDGVVVPASADGASRILDSRNGDVAQQPPAPTSGFTVISMPNNYPTFNPATQVELSCQISSGFDFRGNPVVTHQLTTKVDELKPQRSATEYQTGSFIVTKLTEDNDNQVPELFAYADVNGVASTYDAHSYPAGTPESLYGYIGGILTIDLQDPSYYVTSPYSGRLTVRVDIDC